MEEVINTRLIEKFMEMNGLSKTKFCTMCKISMNSFNKVMNDQNVNLRILRKIAKVMFIPTYMLFK